MKHALSTTARMVLATSIWVFTLAGCTTQRRMQRMERRVRSYLDGVQRGVLAGAPPEVIDVDHYTPARPGAAPVVLDLRRALQTAARHSREYQTARETLYESAISLYVAAHQYAWNTGNSVEADLARDLAGPATTAEGKGSLSFTRRLETGGRLSLNLAVNTLRYLTGDERVNITSLVSATFRQPLLAGRGRLVAREPLTQAERNLVYALRSYIRTRKDLTFRVAEAYYTVLSSQDSVDIAQRNYENLKAERVRSEMMAQAGRLPEFQVDQARQNELSAEATLLSRKQNFQSRCDALKRILGLPLTTAIVVDRRDLAALAAAQLPPPPGTLDQAVAEALAKRLDLATARDRLADARRAVKIARDALQMKLDLLAGASASSATRSTLTAVNWDKGRYHIGLDGELPLDKTAEIAAYKRALITRNQRDRAVADLEDRITSQIRSDWRNLGTGAETYRIQKLSVTLARRRVESTQLLFQAGRVNMRDVLEARDALTRAENQRTQVLVNYRLDWLRLLIDLERFPVRPADLWSPLLAVSPGPAAAAKTPRPKPGAAP